jgi:hypothetical protein
MAAFAAPAAAFLATGADMHPRVEPVRAAPVAEAPRPCCLEVVAAPLPVSAVTAVTGHAGPAQVVAASRWRVVDADIPATLSAGVAPERGLQVKTILAARSISAVFPEIHSIGGVRPDALRWHPNGLALDVMIPNPSSAEGIALGNQIVAFALKNAQRFDLQDAIWRGTYYTPDGAQRGGYGHFDHVHITTHGGGYPTGSELYFR